MTHTELIQRAAKWLKNTKRCGFIATELATWDREIPDVIGWCNGGMWSVLIECKTSVGDFYSDSKKPGRSGKITAGIGRERYYMAEKGVLSAERVERNRPGWGLLEVCENRTRVRLKAIPFDPVCRTRETPFLYSIIRRHNIQQLKRR